MNKKQIENALRDYAWMINEIKRQRELLDDVGDNIVAQSGIDSAMPKAQGNTSDPVAMEVIRREKSTKWVEKLEEKVLFIQERIPVITDEREKAVLECMLDGMSMVAIGRHMGFSRSHIYQLRDSIVDKIAHSGHFGHIKQLRKKVTNKSCCV
ncbi:DNA-binding response regulator [Virgibacillus halodenitrificans]|uniref:helix-turn-helix domain-containing protein n=1 Tax=Virgibacillus halodenitrificans TaxID=1482 RepID=UPI00136DC9FD|nr:DNA-binding response regulator [Virgibacillus halodenitrificans]